MNSWLPVSWNPGPLIRKPGCRSFFSFCTRAISDQPVGWKRNGPGWKLSPQTASSGDLMKA